VKDPGAPDSLYQQFREYAQRGLIREIPGRIGQLWEMFANAYNNINNNNINEDDNGLHSDDHSNNNNNNEDHSKQFQLFLIDYNQWLRSLCFSEAISASDLVTRVTNQLLSLGNWWTNLLREIPVLESLFHEVYLGSLSQNNNNNNNHRSGRNYNLPIISYGKAVERLFTDTVNPGSPIYTRFRSGLETKEQMEIFETARDDYYKTMKVYFDLLDRVYSFLPWTRHIPEPEIGKQLLGRLLELQRYDNNHPPQEMKRLLHIFDASNHRSLKLKLQDFISYEIGERIGTRVIPAKETSQIPIQKVVDTMTTSMRYNNNNDRRVDYDLLFDELIADYDLYNNNQKKKKDETVLSVSDFLHQQELKQAKEQTLEDDENEKVKRSMKSMFFIMPQYFKNINQLAELVSYIIIIIILMIYRPINDIIYYYTDNSAYTLYYYILYFNYIIIIYCILYYLLYYMLYYMLYYQ
jgi:hypothetical protein